jgi:hypothetical protein
MNIKTSELTGAALILAVQQCEASRKDIDFAWWTEEYDPTTNWAQGGPIIEREEIAIFLEYPKEWGATDGNYSKGGDTPLIAAMRCYVASKLGDTIDVPEELTGEKS